MTNCLCSEVKCPQRFLAGCKHNCLLKTQLNLLSKFIPLLWSSLKEVKYIVLWNNIYWVTAGKNAFDKLSRIQYSSLETIEIFPSVNFGPLEVARFIPNFQFLQLFPPSLINDLLFTQQSLSASQQPTLAWPQSISISQYNWEVRGSDNNNNRPRPSQRDVDTADK